MLCTVLNPGYCTGWPSPGHHHHFNHILARIAPFTRHAPCIFLSQWCLTSTITSIFVIIIIAIIVTITTSDMMFVKIFILADCWPIMFYPKSITRNILGQNSVKSWRLWMDCRTYVNCYKCVPSVLVTINCANKMFTFQNRNRVRIIKITPDGASGAILENYENRLAVPKLNLCG